MSRVLPSRDSSVFWYLGTDGQLAQGGQGTADLSNPIELVARSRSYAPAGIGGEAIFTNLYLALFRSNEDTLTLEVTPVIDGDELDEIEIALPAVAEPTREVLEIGLVSYYPSAADPQIATAIRGCWFAAELRTVAAIPTGRLVIEGTSLEFEVVTEGKEATNAS